jgi:hypothetical protein
MSRWSRRCEDTAQKTGQGNQNNPASGSATAAGQGSRTGASMRSPKKTKFWDKLDKVITGIPGCAWIFIFLGFVILLAIVFQEVKTPLGKAAELGDLAEVQSLVEAGAAIDKGDPVNGDTPLEMALIRSGSSKGDNAGVAEYLIARGAHATDGALDLAILNGEFEIARELIDRGAKSAPNSLAESVSSTILPWHPEGVDLFLETGADINMNFKDNHGNNYTALGYAVYYRDFDLVKYLVIKGADVNLHPGSSTTPLQLAKTGYRRFTQGCQGCMGTNYYIDIPPSSGIANFLVQNGAH